MTNEMTEQESLENTKKLLLKWKNDRNIQELNNFYNTKSFSAILGIERSEMCHSNFLSWLLDDKENHQLGQFAIKQLFDILLQADNEKLQQSIKMYKNINFDIFYKSLILDIYDISQTSIITEKVITDKKRIDIVASMNIKFDKQTEEHKLNIIIENKVDSKEHTEQTDIYFNYYSKEYKDSINIFIYLTPNNDTPNNDNFIEISYQKIADNILNPSLLKDITARTKFIIEEYLLSLRKPSKQNKGNIMALGTLERDLLNQFWTNNKELLSTAFKALSIDDSDFKELSDATNDKRKKDNTKYDFNKKKNLGKNKLALEIVKKYVEDNSNTNTANIMLKFNEIKGNMLATQEEAKEKDASSEYKTWFLDNPIALSDKTSIIVNSRIWDSKAINNLIEESGYKEDITKII